MGHKLVYDSIECMKLIKKKYPLIPKAVIRRVLFAEELYMHKKGIINWLPKLSDWAWKRRA